MSMKDDFINFFPEFAPDVVDKYWDNVSESWHCHYGGDYNNKCDKVTILYLIAHLLQTRIEEVDSSNNEGKGADIDSGRGVASRSAGSVSESYVQTQNDTAGGDASFFSSTTYGRQYWARINRRVGGAWV